MITGASRGLGRAFAEVALEAGDNVVATVRDTSSLKDLAGTYGDRLLVLTLDVTDRAAVFAAVEQAKGLTGRLDVLVNNAGGPRPRWPPRCRRPGRSRHC